MESGRTEIRLEPGTRIRTLPLPLLFARLAFLTTPAAGLAAALEEQAAGNPLLSVEPPRADRPSKTGVESGFENEEDFWDSVPALPSLDEALFPQLAMVPEVSLLGPNPGEKLASCLDTRGYLAAPAAELAAALETDEGTLEHVLQKVRAAVDPPGLFARDLAHCLQLQLSRLGLEDSDAWILLEKGREALERQDLAALGNCLGWDRSRVEKAILALRRLDPHPGRGFSFPETVLPEVEIRFDESGTPIVRLLSENLPRLSLDADLLDLAGPWTRSAFRQAKGLLFALAARLRTKLRLALLLAFRQQAFLRNLESAPAPLTLVRAGRELGLSPSTVHRAAACTWAKTPRGTLPLSSLLGRGLSSRPEMTPRALREAIRAGWKSGKSDAAMARELGVPARTVTWHRHRLGLPRNRLS